MHVRGGVARRDGSAKMGGRARGRDGRRGPGGAQGCRAVWRRRRRQLEEAAVADVKVAARDAMVAPHRRIGRGRAARIVTPPLGVQYTFDQRVWVDMDKLVVCGVEKTVFTCIFVAP